MKKKLKILTLIIICISLTTIMGCGSKGNFRNTLWGMSVDEVKKIETKNNNEILKEEEQNNKTILAYKIKWNNYNTGVIYEFNDKGLNNIILSIEDLNLTNEDMETMINIIKKELSTEDIVINPIDLNEINGYNATLTSTVIKNNTTIVTHMKSYFPDSKKIECIINYKPNLDKK